MTFPENLFDLTAEQEATSKMMYNKTIKCLIAPHHSYSELESQIPYTKNTFLFPEREMTAEQCRSLISILANKDGEEFRIVTTNLNIICDMVDSSVRVLTESGKIVDCPCKTFAANIHTIRYEILENKSFKDGKKDTTIVHNTIINKIINDLNSKNSLTTTEYESIKYRIDMIGEPVITSALLNMLNTKKLI